MLDLERDGLRIFTEQTVHESYVGRSILMIRFKAGENPGTEPTTRIGATIDCEAVKTRTETQLAVFLVE